MSDDGTPTGIGTWVVDLLYTFFNHICEDPRMIQSTMPPIKAVYAMGTLRKEKEYSPNTLWLVNMSTEPTGTGFYCHGWEESARAADA